MIETINVCCPYCGTSFDTTVDCSCGSQAYVEDCHICCQPIEFQFDVDATFKLQEFFARRDNE